MCCLGVAIRRADDMKVRVSRIFLLFMLVACVASGRHGIAAELWDERLLSGVELFSRPIDVSTLADPRILETDATMRAFVAEHIGGAKSGREKLRRLLRGMFETGLLSLDYDQVATKTAKQTFYDRVGNCISFTNLFVALGREAGLGVVYQTVDIPPLWYSDSEFVILNNHINVLVNTKFDGRIAVDFNIPEFKGNYDSFVVSDTHAVALYYNNLAMEALTGGDLETSFRYLKKAILLEPYIPGPWVNLGVLYSRNGSPDYALAAYRRGLDLDSDNRSALTNIASLYRSQGKIGAANRYSRRIQAYQRRNPYFHYSRARHSFENDNIDEALESLNLAIKLKENEHQFYFLAGLINLRLGKQQEALQSFIEARELAGYASAQAKYDSKIALLAGSQH